MTIDVRWKTLRQAVSRRDFSQAEQLLDALVPRLELGPPIDLAELQRRAGETEEDVHDRKMRAAGPVLYHYTDQAGFVGIAGERLLRATDTRYLNDTRELLQAQELAARCILEYSRRYARWGNGDHLKLLKSLTPGSSEPVYVFCLSERENDLNQWRAYCPRDGLCLAFATGVLQAFLPPGFRLEPCVYDEGEQRAVVDALLEQTISVFDAETDRLFVERATKATMFFQDGFRRVAPTFKHSAFRSEREWRIISPAALPAGVRRSTRPGRWVSAPVPFVELSFERATHRSFPITDIRIGPTRDPVRDPHLIITSCQAVLSGISPQWPIGWWDPFLPFRESWIPYIG